ncbi:MAG: phosphoribosylformylglycinamidine cyclo-ligase [Acidobacteria bacterium]|nr:phosphoribosylformylglycinamidine cyclo-ligase [Acidobacteriota bacterium]MCA1627904.1 phosphoribosylformylglycinamidine cyclo-ligase [Acidobacteriota bacterium]
MKSVSYSDAGVDIDAATRATDRIKDLARATFNQRTLSEIGSFGGMFDGAFPNLTQPVLVASADGVGTKLKIAFAAGVHNTVGRDLVNHCVNDILVQGARPLFFLDYVATGKLSPEVVASVVEGVANGCRENGCVLLGGETAEMPGFYGEGEYDIAGFIVGVVDRPRVIDGKRIEPGDVLLALPSAGLHTNGYSLARKLFFEIAGYEVNTHVPELGMTAGEALLQPHVSYLRPLEGLLDRGVIKGLAHITGGGLTDNIPRILPEGTAVRIEKGSWPVLPIFELFRRLGNVSDSEMYRTFNMGVGMVIVCSPNDVESIKTHFRERGDDCFQIGEVIAGQREVSF